MFITKFSENTQDVPLIVYLSGGRWQITYRGINSAPALTSERIIDSFGDTMLCGQLDYWGKTQIWEIKQAVTFNQMDRSTK